MTSNEVVLLNTVLSEWKNNAPAGLSDSEYFELFALEQLLKDYDLTPASSAIRSIVVPLYP
jgi:hypothetical protein